jgi:hypothetical protein
MANRYPEDFIRRVKSLYPHDQVMHNLADQHARALVTALEKDASTTMETRTVLKATSLIHLQKLAKLQEERCAIYVECCDILRTWKEEQPRARDIF